MIFRGGTCLGSPLAATANSKSWEHVQETVKQDIYLEENKRRLVLQYRGKLAKLTAFTEKWLEYKTDRGVQEEALDTLHLFIGLPEQLERKARCQGYIQASCR